MSFATKSPALTKVISATRYGLLKKIFFTHPWWLQWQTREQNIHIPKVWVQSLCYFIPNSFLITDLCPKKLSKKFKLTVTHAAVWGRSFTVCYHTHLDSYLTSWHTHTNNNPVVSLTLRHTDNSWLNSSLTLCKADWFCNGKCWMVAVCSVCGSCVVNGLHKALFIHAPAQPAPVPVRRRDIATGVCVSVYERGKCVCQLNVCLCVCVGWQRAWRDTQVVGRSEQEALLRGKNSKAHTLKNWHKVIYQNALNNQSYLT